MAVVPGTACVDGMLAHGMISETDGALVVGYVDGSVCPCAESFGSVPSLGIHSVCPYVSDIEGSWAPDMSECSPAAWGYMCESGAACSVYCRAEFGMDVR